MTEVERSAPPGRVRQTRQAAAIEDVLREADGFRTAQELHDELRHRGDRVGLTTVYRHLNLLVEHHLADVVNRGDGESQYRLCGSGAGSPVSSEHHHHVVCRECGRSVEVAGPEVEEWAERVAAAAGYTDISHTVELFGLCSQHA
ncbi:MAG TPA: transcriptional repressor [Jatrophihabitantaceae bacterium]|jgi:Fur family ferric uptake transcriptional regulator